MAAANTTNPEVVRVLLAAGADISVAERTFGSTALHNAVRTRVNRSLSLPSAEVVHALLEAGGDVEALDSLGRTPLLIAVSEAQADVVRALLDAGADPNRGVLWWGNVPLMRAAEHSAYPEILDLLVNAGAEPLLVTSYGLRAIDYSRDNEALYGTPAYWRLNELSF